jgi:hypothetical protein
VRGLTDRRAERGVLAGLAEAVRAGQYRFEKQTRAGGLINGYRLIA